MATNLFTYSYLPGSHLISGYTAPQPVSSFEFQVSKSYEPNRDLITTVSNTFGTATISTFVYENDGFGRRTARTDVTPTLTVNNAFGYNLKSEVTSATMANGDSSYDYDPIGNRVFASLNALTNTYSANALNQYAVITNSVTSVPLCEIKPSYDYDGNLTTNGVWSYTWDAENRLTAVYSNATLLVSNTYDHQSRRIAKIISRRGAEAQRRDFIYDDWNLIQELITDNGSRTTNSFTWGLDLSSTLQGAGGVGGLLAVHNDSSVYFPYYDANGNITAYVDESGIVKAKYAYDAFGQTIIPSVDMASTFSHRFSTKYADDETGLYYYGYRYYALELGRWLNRDPNEEDGGMNLVGFVENSAVNNADLLGLDTIAITREDYTIGWWDRYLNLKENNTKFQYQTGIDLVKETEDKYCIKHSSVDLLIVVTSTKAWLPHEEEHVNDVKKGAQAFHDRVVSYERCYCTNPKGTGKARATGAKNAIENLLMFAEYWKTAADTIERVDLGGLKWVDSAPRKKGFYTAQLTLNRNKQKDYEERFILYYNSAGDPNEYE